MYLSRLLSGIAGGGAYIFVPLLVAEIAEDRYIVNVVSSVTFFKILCIFYRVRGTLGTIITVSANIGILFAFIAGDLISYASFPVYLMAMPVIFLLVFISFPESPIYLMMMNRNEVTYKIFYS